MRCPDCQRSLPDDSGCPWCASADAALAPVVPISPRLAVERPERPAVPEHPQTAPEGLREARRVLEEAKARKEDR